MQAGTLSPDGSTTYTGRAGGDPPLNEEQPESSAAAIAVIKVRRMAGAILFFVICGSCALRSSGF